MVVSGAPFEGAQFALTYNANLLTLRTDSIQITPNTTDEKKENAASNTTAGTYNFSLKSTVRQEAGSTLVVLPFKVTGHVTEDTVCEFKFTGDTFVCADVLADEVKAQTVKNGSITLEPLTYKVQLTGENGVEFVKNTTDTMPITDGDTIKLFRLCEGLQRKIL